MELARNLTATPKDLSPFELYGEGVILTAASVICALQQERFVFATNIGRRLQIVRTIDLPDQNHVSAQFNYALCLEDGQGVVKNKAEAARYCKLAADQNDADAEYGYALCVAKGRGVPRMKLKLHNITNLLPIKIMHGISSIMRCALGRGEAS
jgi:hypothetical protein